MKKEDRSGIWMGLGLLPGGIAGGTGKVDRGGLWATTVGVIDISKEELSFSELLETCTVDLVSVNFGFISETGGAEGNLFLSNETGDESRITSVSEK